jgi:type II secretory pathway pseudopilin PulG
MRRGSEARGFAYLGVLIAIAVLSVGLTAAAEVWSTTQRRARVAELEWVGAQYEQAIASYYEATPGRVKNYPKRLEDLLEDKRFAFVRRHLRRLYPNPLTGKNDWELAYAPDGGIRAVRAALPGNDVEQGRVREWGYVPSQKP